MCVCVCVCINIASSPLSLLHWQLEVQCPPSVTTGFVAEHWKLCRVEYSLQNETKGDMMGVLGPCSTYGCASDSVLSTCLEMDIRERLCHFLY